jgi:hypothetical protein
MLRKPNDCELTDSIKKYRLRDSHHNTRYQKPLQLFTLTDNEKTDPSSDNIDNSTASKTQAHSIFLNDKNAW